MSKKKPASENKKNNTFWFVFSGVIWFLIVSFIAANTEYPEAVAHQLFSPDTGHSYIHTTVASIVIIISFLPAGFLISYPFVEKFFYKNKLVFCAFASLAIALLLLFAFFPYNFAVNYRF